MTAILVLFISLACSASVITIEDEQVEHIIPFPEEKLFCIENPQVGLYLTASDYTAGFSSHSCVKEYAIESDYRMDFPAIYYISFPEDESLSLRITIAGNQECSYVYAYREEDSDYQITNLIPGEIYYYEAADALGNVVFRDSLKASGRVRMIRTENEFNFRDIGGWKTRDGKSVKYGRVFRGGRFREVSTLDHAVIIEQLGIGVEIDLRSNSELLLDDENPSNDRDYSLLGEEVDYYHYPMPLSNFWSEDQIYLNVFKTVLTSLEHGKNVYIHCAGGADRTGTIILMLEALLNVCDSDMARDYELTSFAPIYYDKDNFRICDQCQKTFNHFGDVVGHWDTTHEIAMRYMLALGATQKEINSFREIMLEPIEAIKE